MKKIAYLFAFLFLVSCQMDGQKKKNAGKLTSSSSFPFTKTEKEWKSQLTEDEYFVTREKGTERAYQNKYWDKHDKGEYSCVCCNQKLFTSETKFESGTGWPSFFQPISKNATLDVIDDSHGMQRTEVVCSNCGAHLGHVFNDGPKPTGLRYCMNSTSLKFIKK